MAYNGGYQGPYQPTNQQPTGPYHQTGSQVHQDTDQTSDTETLQARSYEQEQEELLELVSNIREEANKLSQMEIDNIDLHSVTRIAKQMETAKERFKELRQYPKARSNEQMAGMNTIRSMLMDASTRFIEIESKSHDLAIEENGRRYSIATQGATPELNQVAHLNGGNFLQMGMLDGTIIDTKRNLDNRKLEAQDIESAMRELSGLFQALVTMVNGQSEQLEMQVQTYEAAVIDQEAGNEELGDTKESVWRTNKRKRQCCVIGIVAAIIITIAIVLVVLYQTKVIGGAKNATSGSGNSSGTKNN